MMLAGRQQQRTMQNVAKREPRVNAERYQARIPGLLPRPANSSGNVDCGMEMVCSGEFTPQICAYLDFCRRLTGSLALHGSSAIKPLEEDEEALEFLQVQARGNVERAQLLLIAALGGGSSFKAVKDPEKPRPAKTKTAFRVLITDTPSPQQTNDSTKLVWEQWLIKAKRVLPSTNATELITVLREARSLPLFRAPCDETLVTQYYDTLYQIEGKTRDVEEFIARVHDAVSVVRPEEKWTTAELKRLAEEGPKKLMVRECELLREMANECEAWERQATKWLQEAPNNSHASFTLSQLALFIQDGERSIADHVNLLKNLRKKQRDAQHLLMEISLHLPKHGFKPAETATLAKLKRYRDSLRKLKLKTELDDQLDAIIDAAKEWLDTAQNLHDGNTSAVVVTLDELRDMLKRAKTLPVNLTEERSRLNKVLVQCENWQNRFRALWPAAEAEEEQEDLRSIPAHVVDQLNGLLKETLPVIVAEERTLRASMHTLNWSQRAFKLLSAPKATLPLAEFERLLEDLDVLVHTFDQPPGATVVKRTQKKAKRTLPTLEYEEEIRSVVQQSIEWLRCARLVAEHPHYQLADSKRLTMQEFEDFLAQQPQVSIEPRELLHKVEMKTREFRGWVGSTHKRLVEAGAIEGEQRKLLLSEAELAALVKEASEWGVETQELAVLQRVSQQLKEWKLQCSVLSEAVQEEVQQQLLYKKRKRKQTQERWELSEDDLLKLRERGEELCVEVSLVYVETCMQATEEWKSLLQGPLEQYWKSNTLEGLDHAPKDIFADEGSNASLLQFMRLINADESFPEEKETSQWRDHDLSLEAEDALEEVIRGMQDAEERGLHLVGVDSPPVQAAAWLIQADIWLDRVKNEVLDVSANGVALVEVCQLVFQGLKLMAIQGAEDNDLASHDIFPEKVLDMYFHSSTPYSKRPKLVPAVVASVTTTTTTTTTTAPSSPDLNPVPAVAAVIEEHFDPWPIFKHIKDCNSFDAEGGMHSSMQHDNVTGVLLSRLFGLTRAAQRYFAVRSLVLTAIPRIPRTERTPQMLRGFIDKAQEWTRTIHLQESPEEVKLKQDWVATQACEAEILRYTKQPLACTATVDVLEKLCNKADRLWVDASLVAQLKQTVKSCNNWILRAGEALDAPTVQTANLKRLINEGLEWNKTVNVSQMVQELKQVTDVTCMCRGPRVANIMVSCADCKEIFHRDCVRDFYTTICPVCAAMRAVLRCLGYGYAAVCRVAALELTEQEVQVDNAECRKQLVDWMHEARDVLQLCKTVPEISLPQVPTMLETTFEVKAVCEAFVVLQWSFKLEKMRVKPTLQDLEYTLRMAPKIVPVAALAGLQAICTRGRVLTDWCNQIWALPINTPSSVVLQRCEEAVQQFKYLPLDMASTQREVQACIDDNANRHCICRKFDKGTMMLNCVKCELWFHGSCVGKGEVDAATAGDFYCPACARRN